MKNQKNLGQPLSEQEMKEVKGGNVFGSVLTAKYCPNCGHSSFNLENGIYTCKICGGIITEEELEESSEE